MRILKHQRRMKKGLGTLLILTLVCSTVQFSYPEEAVALTAPTLVDYDQSVWNDADNTPEVTGSVSWQTGDLIVVLGGTENGNIGRLYSPTASGLTFATSTELNALVNDEALIAL